MLTLILLVVLGGGAGLLAVTLSDHRALWARRERREVPSLRPYRGEGTSAPEPAAAPAPLDGAANGTAPAPGPLRRRRVLAAPPSRTAVEGSYVDVAVVPWWRRLVSLGLIIVIIALVGLSIAVVLGAAIAAVAELLNGAIG